MLLPSSGWAEWHWEGGIGIGRSVGGDGVHVGQQVTGKDSDTSGRKE